MRSCLTGSVQDVSAYLNHDNWHVFNYSAWWRCSDAFSLSLSFSAYPLIIAIRFKFCLIVILQHSVSAPPTPSNYWFHPPDFCHVENALVFSLDASFGARCLCSIIKSTPLSYWENYQIKPRFHWDTQVDWHSKHTFIIMDPTHVLARPALLWLVGFIGCIGCGCFSDRFCAR